MISGPAGATAARSNSGSADVLIPVIGGLALVGGFVAWALPRAGALANLRLLG
ncbi:hypothetical protein [Streptomyces sp. NPDC058295]|uniref:hypothetical protein n=1 Tax=Streptomyces sp. NPDC058295 TaxID=3346431 RepID=UPI0036EE466D